MDDDELKLLVKAVLDTSDTGEITSQLQQIAKSVNSQDVFKVTVSLDESATRNRIESQLKAIARSVNAGSSISLNFDTSKASATASDTVRQIRSAVSNSKVMLDVGINSQALARAKSAFKDLKLDDATIGRMSSQLDNMRVRVDSIRGSWEQAGDGAEKFLRLNITGVNELGQEVSLMQTFNKETGEINTKLVSVTDNLKKQRAGIAQAVKQDEARVRYIEQQTAAAEKLKAVYEGASSSKPLTEQAHITEATQAYDSLIASINNLRSASGGVTDAQKVEIEKLAVALETTIKKYQNLEYVATQLRTKTVAQVKGEEGVNLDSYEQSLKSANLLTDSFKSKIDTLRTSLNSAFDRNSLTDYLNGFSQLRAEVDAFKQEVSQAQKIMQQLISLNSKIATQQIRVDNAPAGSEEQAHQQAILNTLTAQREELQKQLTTDNAILETTGKRQAYEDSISMAQEKVAAATAKRSAAEVEANAQFSATQAQLRADLDLYIQQWKNAGVYTGEFADKVAEAGTVLDTATDTSGLDEYRTKLKLLQTQFQQFKQGNLSLSQLVSAETLTTNIAKAQVRIQNLAKTYSSFTSDSKLKQEWDNLFSQSQIINTQKELTNLNAKIGLFEQKLIQAGKHGNSMMGELANNMKKMASWMILGNVIAGLVRGVKGLYTAVVDLDTAMTTLKKVTDETNASYEAFLDKAAAKAVEIGTTYTDFVKSTSDFARLGYSMEDAAYLAEVANIYAVVGDDISSIDQATSSIISTMKAFGIQTSDTMSIVDKFNEVGNRFAISSGGIGDALMRSASALASANNTIDESIALVVAANNVIQDPDVVGTMWKTVSMRIRGATAELEEAGLETEFMAESTSKLRDAIKGLTNVNGKGGFDIMADEDTFKSTYQIILGISKVWKDMSDIDQAALLELIAGKRQGNALSAALTNMGDAVKVYETSLNALGSAEAEHEKWLESIQAKQQQFKAQYEAFANAFLNSGLIKGVFDTGTGILGWLTKLVDTHGALTLLIGTLTTIRSLASNKGFFKLDTNSGKNWLGTGSSISWFSSYNKSQKAAFEAQLVTDTKALQAFEDEVAKSGVTQEGWNRTMRGASAEARAYAVETKGAVGSTDAYSAAQQEAAGKTYGLGVASKVAAVGVKILNAALNMFIGMAIGLVFQGIINAITSVSRKIKENAEAINESAKAAKEEVDSLQDLIKQYKELASAENMDNSTREEVRSIQEQITDLVGQQADNLDLVNGRLDDQIGKLDQISIQNAQENVNALKTKFYSASDEYDAASDTGTNIFGVVNMSGTLEDVLQEVGYVNDELMNANDVFSIIYGVMGKNAQQMLELYQGFQKALLDDTSWMEGVDDPWNGPIGISSNDVLNELQAEIDLYKGLVDEYKKAAKDLLTSEAIIEFYSGISDASIDSTDSMEAYSDSCIDALSSNELLSEALADGTLTIQDIEDAIAILTQGRFPEYFVETNTAVENATAAISTYSTSLGELSDKADTVKSALEILNKAESEMLSGGGLSTDTALSIMEALTEAGKNYLDYLYVENGLVKLNTAAWEEYSKAVMAADIADIETKINQQLARKAELENTLSYYTPGEEHYPGWEEANSELIELNGLIDENQRRLELYKGIYNDIIDDTINVAEAFELVSNAAGQVTSALNAQTTGVGISVETYDALIEADSRYADCLEYSNGRIILNAEAATALSETNIEAAKAQIQANKAVDEAEYARLTSDLANLTDEERNNLDILEQRIAKYGVMSSELDQLTSAYQAFLDAQSGAEQGDMYDDAIEALKVLKDTLYDAESEIYQKVGRAEYKAALEFVVGDVTLEGEALDRAIDAAERYLTEDSSGVGNFVADLIAKGFVDGTTGQLTESTFINGEYVETSIDNIRKYLVDGLTLSEEMVRSMFGELEEYGSEFEWTAFDSASDDLYEAYKTVKQIKDALDEAYATNSDEVTELSQALVDANAALAEQERLSTERVSTYLKITEDIQTAQGILDELRESGASEVDIAISEEGLAELQTLKDTLGEPTQLELEVAEKQLTALKGQIDSAWDAGDTKLLVTLGVAESEDGVTQSAVDAKIAEIENQLSSLQLLIDTSQGEEVLNDFNSYTSYVEDFFGKTYTLQVNTSAGQSRLSSINSQLNSIRNNLRTLSSFSITFSANSGESELFGSFGTAFAGGRYSPFSGGKVLAGELGQELVVDPNTGKWYTVGNNGAEFVTLPKNAIVFNHKQTERLMASGRVSARGFAMAYGTAKANDGVSGTINITNIYNANGGTLGGKPSGGTPGGKPSAVTDNTSLEERLKETLEKMADEIAKIISNFEHSIFLMEKNGGSTEDMISTYEAMQQVVHEQAQKYRAMGLDDNSDYIQELQKQWWDYQDSINELQHAVYEKFVEDTEHSISLLKSRFEQAAAGLNLPDMRSSLSEQMDAYKDIMEAAHAEAERLRAKGVKENDELMQNLQKTWWGAYAKSKDILTQIGEDIRDTFSDALDDVQDVYDTLIGATEEYAENGFISVDTFQDILALGTEYLAYLVDENGMLKVNKEAIEAMTAAKVDDLAVTQAMTLIDTIKQYKDDVDALNALAFATNTATTATWGLVYAELAMLGLDDQLYTAFLNQINAIRAMAESAKQGIGQNIEAIRESNEETKDALDTILDLTKELIKWEVENQVEALEAQVDAYKKIVELKKESIAASKEESNYQKDVSERVKKIADIQSKLRQLERDDSREAQAERASLSEELADLQVDLADYQADYAYNAQVDALDAEYEAYEELKQREMDVLEATISSEEKLYQLAIDRINNQWDTLYADIIAYNYEAGNTIESEIVSAWNLASAAVQQYGSYAAAAAAAAQSGTNNGYIGETQYGSGTGSDTGLTTQGSNIKQQMMVNSIAWYTANDAQRTSLETSQQALVKQWKDETGEQLNRVNGTWYRPNGQAMYSSADIADQAIPMIVSAMKANSNSWANASRSTKDALSAENKKLGGYLQGLTGQSVTIDSNGVWWIGNRKLYDVYHGGLDKGYVGSNTGSADEILAILRKGELVLTKEQYTKIAQTLADGGGMVGGIISKLTSGSSLKAERIIETVTNNSEETDNSSGDTFIETVKFEYPGAISREEKNEIAQWTLGVIQDGIKKSGIPASTGRFRTKN